MAENTHIEWATHTFNPWRGCTKVSAGCTHCYADTLSKRGEQYTGWKALPDGGAASTRETAAAFLSEHSGIVVTAQNTDKDGVTRAYRIAARKLHPDAGGDHDDFVKLGKAVETLKGKE